MRPKTLYVGMMLAATLLLASCNTADSAVNTDTNHTNTKNNTNTTNTAPTSSSPETAYADGARRITTAELAALIKEGKAYVVDVRSQDSFDMGHIPGARLIPSGLISNHVNELPRDKTIVTYCS